MNVSVKRKQTILGKPSASELTDLRRRTEKEENVLDHTNLNDDDEELIKIVIYFRP
jgi:hypothetical protein